MHPIDRNRKQSLQIPSLWGALSPVQFSQWTPLVPTCREYGAGSDSATCFVHVSVEGWTLKRAFTFCNEWFMHCSPAIISLSLCNCWPTVLADSVWSHPALALDIAQTPESSNASSALSTTISDPFYQSLFHGSKCRCRFTNFSSCNCKLVEHPLLSFHLAIFDTKSELRLCEWILSTCHLDRLRYGVGVCQCGLQGRADCSTGTVGEGATRQHTGAG